MVRCIFVSLFPGPRYGVGFRFIGDLVDVFGAPAKRRVFFDSQLHGKRQVSRTIGANREAFRIGLAEYHGIALGIRILGQLVTRRGAPGLFVQHSKFHVGNRGHNGQFIAGIFSRPWAGALYGTQTHQPLIFHR